MVHASGLFYWMRMNPLIVSLAISIALNAGLGYAWLGQRDDTATAKQQANNAADAAKTCSDSVDDLQTKALDRAKQAAKDRAAAAAIAKNRDELADAIMSTPASNADDCTAARDRVEVWLKGRK